MGIFDEVWADCPKCNSKIEFQSKAGDCMIYDFDLESAPLAIRADVIGATGECFRCKTKIVVRGEVKVWTEIVEP